MNRNKFFRCAIVTVLVLCMVVGAFPIVQVQAQAFTYDYNFVISDGSWVADTDAGTPMANYVSSTGWESVYQSSQNDTLIAIRNNTSGPDLDRMEVTYTATAAITGGYGLCVANIACTSGDTQVGTHTIVWDFTGTGGAFPAAVTMHPNAFPGGGNTEHITITHVQLFGPGHPPPTSCSTSWTVTHDFTQQENFGWLPVDELGALAKVDQEGYNGAIAQVPTDHSTVANYLSVQKSIPSTAVTSIDLDVDYSPGAPGSPDLRQISVTSGGATLLDAAHPPVSGRHTYHWTGSQGAGIFQINAYATGAFTSLDPFSTPTGSVVVKSIAMSGTGVNPDGVCVPDSTGGHEGTASAWAYPVSKADQITDNPIRYVGADVPVESPFAAITQDLPSGTDRAKIGLELYSNHGNAHIHSMTDGTVLSVSPISSGSNICLEFSLTQWLTTPISNVCQHNEGVTFYEIDYHSASLVTVQLTSGTVSYVVSNAEVQAGQTVTAGCILGETLTFYVLQVKIPNIVSAQVSTDGYALVQARDSSGQPFDILPYLQIDPLDVHCSQQSTGGCTLVNNPSFAAPASEWTPLSSDNPITTPVGEPSGYVVINGARQSLVLDSSKTYAITIKSHLLQPIGDIAINFSVQLGSNDPTLVQVRGLSSETTIIPAASYTASISPDQYDLVIRSTANTRSNVVVDYVCVADTDQAQPLPSDCILYNPEIDDSSHWTPSGSVIFAGGLAELPNGSSIQQDLTLFPSGTGAQNYTLSVDARRKGTPASGQSAELDWSWNGGSPASMGTFADQLTKTVQVSFSVSAQTTGTLVLSSVSSPDQTLQIDRVCIGTTDGTPPPGYQIPPVSMTPSCKVCTYSPVGDVNVDLPEMIAWLECSLSQIWFCQMRSILMGIWFVVTNILTLLGTIRLWFQYAFQAGATMLNSDLVIVARWGNAQFVNLANQLTDAIRYGPISSTQITGSTGANFFDAVIGLVQAIQGITGSIISGLQTVFNDLRDVILTLINQVIGLATFVFGLVGGIVTLIINGVFAVVFTILNLIHILIGAIVTAAGTPPIAPAGMPMCDTGASLISESCLPIFMLDKTVFADGSIIGTILPLFEAACALGLVWWAINRFRNALAGIE